MRSRGLRALAAALLGATAAAAWLVLAYSMGAGFRLDMSRDHPAILTGFHPIERDDSGLTFAWTRKAAELDLAGLDRRVPWRVTVRLRGARPDPATLPDVVLAVDGVTAATHRTTNAFEEVHVLVPPQTGGRRGTRVTLSASSTFTPGPADPRALGVVVDEISVAPVAGVVLPPRRALGSAALAASAFGALFGLIGLLPSAAIGGVTLLGLGQAIAMGRGVAPYSTYADRVPLAAFWIAAGTLAAVVLLERPGRPRLRNTARFVAAFSASALFLKLLVLLHPGIPIGDALFHAHRFEWVLDGRYYFTSLAPGLYDFPYPIALYVFAAPFRFLASGTMGYVALLRIVAASVDAATAVLLYWMIVRAWGDRLSGAMAVGIYHLLPLTFAVQGTGNLTNVFSQAFFLPAMALLTTPALGLESPRRVAAAAIVMTIALLGHTSTFVLLLVTCAATAALYFWRLPPGPSSSSMALSARRSAAQAVLAAGAAAAVISVVVYYGHFGEVYRSQLSRIAGEMAGPEPADPAGRTVAHRVSLVPGYIGAYFGWPSAVLAIAGFWRFWQGGARDRLTLGLAAWGLTSLFFLLVGLVSPVDLRHYLAALPVVAAAAGVGAATAWRDGGVPRALAGALLGWTIGLGVTRWAGWIA